MYIWFWPTLEILHPRDVSYGHWGRSIRKNSMVKYALNTEYGVV